MMSHIVLENGGYGNIVFNLMFLMQIRIQKLFDGGKFLRSVTNFIFLEDFNDNHFSHYFLKLYDMMVT